MLESSTDANACETEAPLASVATEKLESFCWVV